MLELGPMTTEADKNWTINDSYAESNRFKKYGKTHPSETTSCFANLGRVCDQLRAGEPFGSFRLNVFRHEFGNVWRVGQTNVPSARETRLYLLVAVVQKTLYVLTIGDKDSQRADLARCRGLETKIIREHGHEQSSKQ